MEALGWAGNSKVACRGGYLRFEVFLEGKESGEALSHDDEYARNFRMERRRERRHLEQFVAEAFVVRAQWGNAGAEGAEPDRVATGVAGEIFGLRQDVVAEADALVFGCDGEQAEVAAGVLDVWLEVDAGDRVVERIVVEKEFAFGHVVAHAGVVDAIVVEDGAFDDERGVDEACDGGDVGIGGDAEREIGA